jgi:hypothetical protein
LSSPKINKITLDNFQERVYRFSILKRGDIMEKDFTITQQREIAEARDAYHRVILAALEANDVDYSAMDITEVGESIALEGRLF